MVDSRYWAVASIVGISTAIIVTAIGTIAFGLVCGTIYLVAAIIALQRSKAGHSRFIEKDLDAYVGLVSGFFSIMVVTVLYLVPLPINIKSSLGFAIIGLGFLMWVFGSSYSKMKARQ